MRWIISLLLLLLLVAPASALGAVGDSRILLAEGILAELKGDGPGMAALQDAATWYPEYPRAVNDSAGVTTTLYRPADRIIVMNSDAADAISILGIDDQVVGVGDVIPTRPLQFPTLTGVQSIGKYNEPDIEGIMALRPDLLISYVLWPDAEKLDRHLPDRIGIIKLDFYKADAFRDELSTLAHITGSSDAATEYIEWYDGIQTLVNERISRIPDDERARVFIDYGSGRTTGRRTMAEGTGLHDIVTAAGGINVAAGYVTGYADVENEWVIKERPDLVLIWSPKGGYVPGEEDLFREARDDLMTMPGFGNIPAIRDDEVYVISSAFGFGSSSPVAVLRVAMLLYPDEFDDIDFNEVHQEYFSRFTQSDEEIHTLGTFYYPER